MAIRNLLVILLTIGTVVGSSGEVGELWYINGECDTKDNFTDGSIYQANLKQLQLSLLSSMIPSDFSNITVGQYPNQVFGLALCRGDVSAENCQLCMETAITNASAWCPYVKSERVWLEYCFLRYSDTNFFSIMRTFGYFFTNRKNATDPEKFAAVLGPLMTTLISQAANSSNMFAAGYVTYTNFSNKLYGLAQCTRDLAKNDCYKCLDGCVQGIPTYCKNAVGCRLHGMSCNIRYETYSFYNDSAVPNAAAPPPPPAAAPAPAPPAEVPPAGKTKGSTKLVLIVGLVVGALIILLGVCGLIWAKKMLKPLGNVLDTNQDGNIGTSEGSIFFDLSTVRSATNNFSEENKLGEGGFGPVYKGKLINGQEIAVKMLSGNSHQGLEHLKNEVNLLVNLQHKNLVKLLGCSIDGSKKLLVYEYLSNTSLDNFLFDSVKRLKLDWQIRLKIIEGIARGLVYLHEDSRLKIVHRDLKVSNILLDADMNPKIADFGLAKLFNIDATHANTSRIAGTYGYMAPEYAMRGLFSTKSDVFSYGIIVLEILTGRTVFCMTSQMDEDLISYVWRNWSQGMPLEAIDKSVTSHNPSRELIRCLHIALLCVQEEPSERPDMATVIFMLRNESVTLPALTTPTFLLRSVISSTTDSQVPHSEESYGMSTCENAGTGRTA